MARCQTCGRPCRGTTIEVLANDGVHIYDSFECAMNALGGRCDRCGARILGDGVQHEGDSFCSIRCAAMAALEYTPIAHPAVA